MKQGKCVLKCISFTLFTIVGIGSANATTLNQAIQATVDTHPEVQAASHRRQAAKEQLKQDFAGFLPTITASAGYGPEASRNSATRGRGKSGYSTLYRTDSQLRVVENIFNGLETRNTVVGSKENVRSQAYAVRETANALALEAVDAYLRVLELQRDVAIARKNVKRNQEIANMIGQRSESGVSKKADSVQARGRVALAQADLKQLQQRYRDAVATYVEVVGHAPTNLRVPQFPHNVLPHTKADATHMALVHNWGYLSAKATAKAACYAFKAARGAYYPSINLEATGGWNDDRDGTRGTDNEYLGLVTMNYNLFNGGADVARVHEAGYLAQEAKANEERVRRQVVEALEQAWNSYTIESKRTLNLREHMETTAKTVTAYEKQFQLGQRTLFDLLNEQRESFNSKIAYTNSQFTLMFAKYRILNLMGMLLHSHHIILPVTADIPPGKGATAFV